MDTTNAKETAVNEAAAQSAELPKNKASRRAKPHAEVKAANTEKVEETVLPTCGATEVEKDAECAKPAAEFVVQAEEKTIGTSKIVDNLCALVAEGSGIAIVPVNYVGEAFEWVRQLLCEHRIAIVEIDGGNYALLSFEFIYDEYGFTGNTAGFDITARWNTEEKIENLINSYISEADYYLGQIEEIQKLETLKDPEAGVLYLDKKSKKAKKAKSKKAKKAKVKAETKAKKAKAKKAKAKKAKAKKSKK